MAAFDMKKLDTSDRIVVGASALTIICLFLPWYGASGGGFSVSVSGFSSGYGWLGALLIIAAGVYLAMVRAGSNMPNTGVGPGVAVLGLSVLGTLIVIIRWITIPSGSGLGYTYGPMFGMYLTILAGLVQAVLAFRLFKRSGEAAPWDAKRSAGGPPAA
jgi:hypothetical protein